MPGRCVAKKNMGVLGLFKIYSGLELFKIYIVLLNCFACFFFFCFVWEMGIKAREEGRVGWVVGWRWGYLNFLIIGKCARFFARDFGHCYLKLLF